MATVARRSGRVRALVLRWGFFPIGVMAVVVPCVVRFLALPPEAEAGIVPPIDSDSDLLSDVTEMRLLLNPANPDTDGDGVPDGFEYILYSDPKDPQDQPVITPAFRMSASYDKNNLKLTLYFLPGSDDLLEAFAFYLYSPVLGLGGGKSSGGADITKLLPSGISEVGYSVHNGFVATSYTIELPLTLIEQLAPVSLGASARIADVTMADTVYAEVIDGVPVILHGLGVPESSGSLESDTLPWDPLVDEIPPGWGDQEVCQTRQEVVDVGDGLIEYEIVSAECKPVINRYCYSDCPSRVGSTIITLDYDFLIGLVVDHKGGG